MPPEDDAEDEKEGEEADEEEDGEDDDESPSPTSENAAEAMSEVIIPREVFLDLLYLAIRNGAEGNSESMNWEEGDASFRSANYSDVDSDCDVGDSDGYSDGDNEDEESEMEVILEEIRRISEALLGSTMSELVDAERRLSLKSFDELAARDESLSSIMDEWDYEDSEGSENDDCQGVIERFQLFMRPTQREAAEGPITSQPEGDGMLSRTVHRRGRSPSNSVGAPNIFVVFFDPGKLGVFSKFARQEEARTPKVRNTVSMKRPQQRIRLDKDSVRRWNEDAEKEAISRVLRTVSAVSREEPGAEASSAPGASTASAATTTPAASPLRTAFAVSLAVGAARPADVRVALYTNRVLEAEVMRPAGAEAGVGAGAADDAPPTNSVLVRHWPIPEGVDVNNFRCFLGDGLLLVTVLPLPEGFVWPFVNAPLLLGCPVLVPCPCRLP